MPIINIVAQCAVYIISTIGRDFFLDHILGIVITRIDNQTQCSNVKLFEGVFFENAEHKIQWNKYNQQAKRNRINCLAGNSPKHLTITIG